MIADLLTLLRQPGMWIVLVLGVLALGAVLYAVGESLWPSQINIQLQGLQGKPEKPVARPGGDSTGALLASYAPQSFATPAAKKFRAGVMAPVIDLQSRRRKAVGR